MKSTWSADKQALVPSQSFGVTTFDGCPWPGSKKIPQVSNSEVASVCIALGVEGASHHAGRQELLQKYAAFLDKAHKAAGDAAVAELLKKVSL
jgi:hypothetical protein